MRRALPAALTCLTLLGACTRDPAPAPPVASPSGPPAAPPPAQAPGHDAALAAGHPRLWVTPEDLPRLRSWAVPSNPLWQHGLAVALRHAIAAYDKDFFPGGQDNPSWPDPGNDNWTAKVTEAYAEFFAFLSLVDPSPAARAEHAQRAKRLLMHAIHEAERGADPSQNPAPFRAKAFATYNRANGWGEAWGLTVDWIYGALDAADKAAIRKVFLRWADDNVNAATSIDEHPQPVGLLDDPRLLANRQRLRVAANNYYLGHMRQLTLMAASFDAADDPPIDPSAPAGKLGNTLRSYLDDAIGAWLYQEYALYEDPAKSSAALHVPPDGLGDASGGLPVEGVLYGTHISMLHEALLALFTAGCRDPAKYGPQIGMIDSGYWDRRIDGFLQSLAPAPVVIPSEQYLGSVYLTAGYGDVLRAWETPEQAQVFASIGIYDQERGGDAARLAKVRWIAANAVEGGAEKLTDRVSRIWGESRVTQALQDFMLFDPAAPPAPDPRPSLPLSFVDRSLGRVIARTGWGPDASMFDYKCSYNAVGHQNGDCNLFELMRKGEWLVKVRLGYANDNVSVVSDYANTLAVQNAVTSGAPKPRDLQWFEETTWKRGGQFLLHQHAGDPRVVIGLGAGWVYAFGDATNLYNRPRATPDASAVEATHVSRSIAWIEPDKVVVYDRAATRSAGLFKRWNLTLLDEPHVSGATATATTPHGQQIFVHLLAPAGATMTASPAESFNKVAEGDPTRFHLLVEDPSNPREVRFLHVIEGADPGAHPSPVQRIESKAGTPFEGASVGASAALFPVDPSASFTGVTFAVPAEVTGELVGGLAPRGGYDVSIKRAGASAEVTVSPGSAYHADEAGVLAIGTLAARPR